MFTSVPAMRQLRNEKSAVQMYLDSTKAHDVKLVLNNKMNTQKIA